MWISSIAAGSVRSRRADQRLSDRSCPRASSSVARPPSRTIVADASGVVTGPGSGAAGEVGRRPLDETTVAARPDPLAVADDDRAAAHHDVRRALDLAALVARVVDVHVVGGCADRAPAVRVVDDDVGIGADRDRALPRVHPEELGRRRRGDLDPSFPADPAGYNAAVVEEVHPILDPGQAVGDLAEVAHTEVLLAVEVERTVVGRNDRQIVLHESAPELVRVIGRTERRRADVLGALEAVAQLV